MSVHDQDDAIGFCGDMRHPDGCQDEADESGPTTVDAELSALAGLVDVFEPLDDAARRRVLDWANDRFWPKPAAGV